MKQSQSNGNIIKKKTPTKEKLLASALELFSRHWYETVSVAEICRNAELSNGIFYRYFKKKEDAFKELLEEYLELYRTRLQKLDGKTIEERLEKFIDIVYKQGKTHTNLLSVYREGQYRFPEYEKRLRDIYGDAVSRVFGREIDEAEYLYMCAGVRFVSIRSIFNRLVMDKKLLKNAVLEGIFSENLKERGKIIPKRLNPLEDEGDGTSRSRFIESGIKLFGEHGYYNISVYDVAKDAGFAVGTFYLYFPTKEDFLSEIVKVIGHRTRKFISINLNPELNRLERELQGIYLFLTYFHRNRQYYTIVREAEFVVNEDVNNYYNAFEAGYLKDLDKIKYQGAKSKKILANFFLGISHYFGIEVLFSENISDHKGTILKFGEFFQKGIKA